MSTPESPVVENLPEPNGSQGSTAPRAQEPQRGLSWKDHPTREHLELLSNLQANILKGHGRSYVRLIFLRFEDEPARRVIEEAAESVPRDARDRLLDALRDAGIAGLRPAALKVVDMLGGRVTYALDQLRDTDAMKAAERPWARRTGNAVITFSLTHAGYEALGLDHLSPGKDGDAFRDGMTARDIGDPGPDELDPPFRWRAERPVHAVVMIAHSSEAELDQATIGLQAAIGQLARTPWGLGVTMPGSETGRVLAPFGYSVEHFGYADGLSQPRFLEEDRDGEVPPTPWQKIVVNGESGPGSFLVYRKLEQDYAEFVRRRSRQGGPPLRAGAEIVGRFEDGTPRTLSDESLGGAVSNDFSYDRDEGEHCPARAHIRAVNPRHGAVRSVTFPRRGIPYDYRPPQERAQWPTPGEGGRYSDEAAQKGFAPIEFKDDAGNPRRNALGDPIPPQPRPYGLLFMCYNADIESQFEQVQKEALDRNDALLAEDGGRRVVTMRGGEYFFTPGRHFFDAVHKAVEE